ncbi:MAG: alpha-amylase family glycosyl hydrolase [Chitinophagaceae bacterium]
MNKFFVPVDWSYNTNIYEINLRQYTVEGTFNAFTKELPRLKEMGVEVLWFMPITPISKEKRLGTLGSYYACSDYNNTNAEFGSLDDFRNLVKAAHELQFKIVIDWVANHTGWDHHWTREHPEYYLRNHNGQFFDQHGWEDVIDLNYGNPDLQLAMKKAMKFWIDECDIDGFRCDMAMLVPLSFWKSVRTELDKMKKLFWLAECEEINYHEVFDATYSWKFLHKMEAFWRRETGISGLEEVLNFYHSGFPPNAFHLLFTTNHDENSHSGSEYERMGNAAIPFNVLCCTWNGIPLIYSGQEMPNKKRLKFFEKDTIEWTGNYELAAVYKQLLLLRKRNPALQAGDRSETHRLSTGKDHLIYAFIRKHDENQVLVLINLSDQELTMITKGDNLLNGSFQNIFSGETSDFSGDKQVNLRPWEYLVFEKTR